jgi:hypothetical protein
MFLRQYLLLLQEYLRESTLDQGTSSIDSQDSFVFLIELFDTERLFQFHDFRITRVLPKSENVEQFVVSMHLVLDLVD